MLVGNAQTLRTIRYPKLIPSTSVMTNILWSAQVGRRSRYACKQSLQAGNVLIALIFQI
jgi:hypothetical protein